MPCGRWFMPSKSEPIPILFSPPSDRICSICFNKSDILHLFSETNSEYCNWSFKQDGASLITRILFEEATDINFFVGCAINPAHQGEDVKINFAFKMQLIEELSKRLKSMGKNVKVSYF